MEDPFPIVHEDWKRERLTKKISREPVEMSSSSSGPKRMRLSCLRVSNVNAVQKPSTRTEESIAKSRAEHIKHLLETGVVKDWNRDDAIKTGAKILSGKMVDDAHKEKSRYCAREFATFKDPSVFAAASDVDNTSLIDLLAVKKGSRYHVFLMQWLHLVKLLKQLIFIEAPEEHRAVSCGTARVADPMVGYWCRVGSLALTHTRTDIFGAVAIWDQRRTMLSNFVVPPTARLHQGCWLCFIRVLPGLVTAPPGVRAGSGPLVRSRLTTGLLVCSECMPVMSCIGSQSPA